MPSGFDITGGGLELLFCISAHPPRHRAPAAMEAVFMKVRREIRFLWSFFVVLVSPDMFTLLANAPLNLCRQREQLKRQGTAREACRRMSCGSLVGTNAIAGE